MRIASAMVRPHVVSFMDKMLHTDEGLRVEEVGGARWICQHAIGHTAAQVQRLFVDGNP